MSNMLDDNMLSEDDIEEETERKSAVKYRSGVVTLHQLLEESILQPGQGVFTIEYMGQTFTGDLLPDGKIKSLEINQVFSSPSAWATHCKKIINPGKSKSGCGWSSVKYKGQKLDAFKTAFIMKKRNKEQLKSDSDDDESKYRVSIPVEHSRLGNRSSDDDLNTLVECAHFHSIGRIQPFSVTFCSNALLVMEFHCHVTHGQVVGYLAGRWDVVSHNVIVEEVVPVRCRLGDTEAAATVEYSIYLSLLSRGLSLLGWYHSHPTQPARPSLRDLDAQMEYQIKMKGNNDASYTPCIGIICSPYLNEASEMLVYWVMPPPEIRPHEYGKPLLIEYQITQNQKLNLQLLNEMKLVFDFYKNSSDLVNMNDNFNDKHTYWEKLKKALTCRFPRCCTDDRLAQWIKNIVT